ncbi:hypothetical protein TRV_02441 [Trichophyton verrucosum HKI 0517]|uniref:Uncharacterized protein n=1 Tax=Trichophyton verrucosum (strain HKI 0517) TaxID=663202 RepID=D4D5R8_TRIVH|nr:uncharacterized protein TRV_02441 [Trichophyton verrucosum HKI 0517]EFE42721.1 hypothetical protein TRV_02441 [Trichophyton verrucosum HKI 0517]
MNVLLSVTTPFKQAKTEIEKVEKEIEKSNAGNVGDGAKIREKEGEKKRRKKGKEMLQSERNRKGNGTEKEKKEKRKEKPQHNAVGKEEGKEDKEMGEMHNFEVV